MKKITFIICLILSVAMLLSGCNYQTKGEESSDNTEISAALELIVNGEAKYGLVRAFSMSNDAIKAVGELYNEISKVTGVSMQIVTDDRVLDEGVKEILIYVYWPYNFTNCTYCAERDIRFSRDRRRFDGRNKD